MIGLPLSVVTTTCKVDQGCNQCRYLARYAKHNHLYYCLKNEPPFDELVDGERRRYDNFCRRNDKLNNFPAGDHCPGFRAGEFLEST